MVPPKVIPILDVDATASASCTASCAGHIHCLLKQVPPTASIFGPNAAAELDRMNDIWRLIRTNGDLVATNNFGPTGISKMLARKRPGLVPITDSVATERVLRAQGGSAPTCSWCFIRSEFAANPTLLTRVAQVRAAADVPAWYTDLRVIDIVVWMSDTTGC